MRIEMLIFVLDEDKYFSDDFVHHVKFHVSQVFDAHVQQLPLHCFVLGQQWLAFREGSGSDIRIVPDIFYLLQMFELGSEDYWQPPFFFNYFCLQWGTSEHANGFY